MTAPPHHYDVRLSEGPLPAGTDIDRVRRALMKTERARLVAASLCTPIRVEPQLVAA